MTQDGRMPDFTRAGPLSPIPMTQLTSPMQSMSAGRLPAQSDWCSGTDMASSPYPQSYVAYDPQLHEMHFRNQQHQYDISMHQGTQFYAQTQHVPQYYTHTPQGHMLQYYQPPAPQTQYSPRPASTHFFPQMQATPLHNSQSVHSPTAPQEEAVDESPRRQVHQEPRALDDSRAPDDTRDTSSRDIRNPDNKLDIGDDYAEHQPRADAAELNPEDAFLKFVKSMGLRDERQAARDEALLDALVKSSHKKNRDERIPHCYSKTYQPTQN